MRIGARSALLAYDSTQRPPNPLTQSHRPKRRSDRARRFRPWRLAGHVAACSAPSRTRVCGCKFGKSLHGVTGADACKRLAQTRSWTYASATYDLVVVPHRCDRSTMALVPSNAKQCTNTRRWRGDRHLQQMACMACPIDTASTSDLLVTFMAENMRTLKSLLR
jgi:hypothetical protein